MSGRNTMFYNFLVKELRSFKPKLGMRELAMEPDFESFMQVMRCGANRLGTVETREPYVAIAKTQKIFGNMKTQQRRYTPGNTAFKVMYGLP
eukprot:1480656-Amphidinium_carterae.1